MTAPVVLGGGKRLFGDGTPPATFKLIEHRVTSNGVAMATYEPAGEVQTGSFADAGPSQRGGTERAAGRCEESVTLVRRAKETASLETPLTAGCKRVIT